MKCLRANQGALFALRGPPLPSTRCTVKLSSMSGNAVMIGETADAQYSVLQPLQIWNRTHESGRDHRTALEITTRSRTCLSCASPTRVVSLNATPHTHRLVLRLPKITTRLAIKLNILATIVSLANTNVDRSARCPRTLRDQAQLEH